MYQTSSLNFLVNQIKSRSAARAGLLRRDESELENEDRNNASVQRWIRRLGLEEQRLYEMVRLRGQFLELLRDAGLCSAGEIVVEKDRSRNGDKNNHRRALQQAQHCEHLKTKRRRVLTLQDNVDQYFS